MDRQVTAVLLTIVFFGFFVLLIGWLIVAAFVGRKRERERTQQMVNVANLLGWQFSERRDWIPNLETFALSIRVTENKSQRMYGQILREGCCF